MGIVERCVHGARKPVVIELRDMTLLAAIKSSSKARAVAHPNLLDRIDPFFTVVTALKKKSA